MAQLSRWAIFLRAFLITLVTVTPGRLASATPEETAAWAVAVQTDTVEGYYSFLSRFPAGSNVERAVAALARLGAIDATPATRRMPATPRPSRPGPAVVAAEPVGNY